MTTVYLIGMGPGGPEYLTMQAIDALRRVDVFLILEKDGTGKQALTEARRRILDTYREHGSYRIVTAPSPGRRAAANDYLDVVADWHQRKAATLGTLLRDELRPGETAGLLVWGDPSLYDSSIAILHRLQADMPALRFEVIPGITSVQVLAARHRIPLHGIGEEVRITTARRLADAAGGDIPNTVVMLDSNAAFFSIPPEDLDIYWGAYLGSPDEMLAGGPLTEVREELAERVAAAKRRHGWILDIYLLRRRATTE